MNTTRKQSLKLQTETHGTSVRLPKDLLARAEALHRYVSVSQLLRDGLAIAVTEAERKFKKT